MKPIKIAGAGISGLTAAIILAKNGVDVEVFEKNDCVGKRFHGDLQGLENWSQKQDTIQQIASYGIDTSFPYEPMSQNLQIWTSTKRLEISDQAPFYYCVKRGSGEGTLDSSLYEQALQTGKVKINFNSPISDLSSVDIVATGPVLQDPATDILAVGYVFQTDYPNAGVILLDDDYAPDGYSYFLTMNGTGVAVSVMFRDYANANDYSDKTYELLEKELGFKVTGERRPFSGIGNLFIRKDFDPIAIGEAGGFQDFVAGFGMRYAIQSGYLAAKSVLEGKNYTEMIRDEIHPSMRAAIANRLVYRPFSKLSYDRLADAITSTNQKHLIHRLYSPRWWHSLIYPIASMAFHKTVKDPRD